MEVVVEKKSVIATVTNAEIGVIDDSYALVAEIEYRPIEASVQSGSVQGPKGDPGEGPASWTSEQPIGSIDGSNATFALSQTPVSGSLILSLNGLTQHVGSGNDYTISGAVITFQAGAIPQSGDSLFAVYSY